MPEPVLERREGEVVRVVVSVPVPPALQLTALRWPASLMSASIATLARVSEALTGSPEEAVEHARVST
jgi:hypothetical protein